MQSFTTTDIHDRRKIDFWNEINCNTFSKMSITPADRKGFEGDLHTETIGDLTVTAVSSSPGILLRSKQDVINDSDQRFFLLCQTRGTIRIKQNGNEILLRENEFALSDDSQPYRFVFDNYCSTVNVAIPHEILKNYFPVPEKLLGLRVSARDGLSHITVNMLQSLADQIRNGHSFSTDTALAKGIIAFISSTYNDVYSLHTAGSTASITRRLNIKYFIENHLADEVLCPGMVAAAFNISHRYLCMLFEAENETVSRYIMRRRLEECARQLRSPAWSHATISEIACRWGFSNMTHFGQAFKKQYGHSPSDYRRFLGAGATD